MQDVQTLPPQLTLVIMKMRITLTTQMVASVMPTMALMMPTTASMVIPMLETMRAAQERSRRRLVKAREVRLQPT